MGGGAGVSTWDDVTMALPPLPWPGNATLTYAVRRASGRIVKVAAVPIREDSGVMGAALLARRPFLRIHRRPECFLVHLNDAEAAFGEIENPGAGGTLAAAPVEFRTDDAYLGIVVAIGEV